MGYRFNLYVVNKEELEKIKDKTYKELAELYGDVYTYEDRETEYLFSPYDLPFAEKFHCLGKYLDNKLYDGLYNNTLGTYFNNKEVVEKITNENDFGFLDAERIQEVFRSIQRKSITHIRKYDYRFSRRCYMGCKNNC